MRFKPTTIKWFSSKDVSPNNNRDVIGILKKEIIFCYYDTPGTDRWYDASHKRVSILAWADKPTPEQRA